MTKPLRLLLAGLLLVAAAANAAPAAKTDATRWEAGRNYFLVDPPQPTDSGDKVEVLEVFSYACSHCANFQPYADQIKASLPAYATFAYMPAVFNAQWEPYARAYYAAQSLGVLDKTHEALFDALHRDRKPMRSIEDLSAFYAEHGVDRAKFLATAGSFEVENRMQRSIERVKAFGVDGTPTLIVNGKYRVTTASAGGQTQLIELIGHLVEKEHAAAAPKAARAAAAK